jgi:light-harvesting complex 1 beta chain
MSNDQKSLTGLSDDEAQEFHKFYIQGFLGFTATAVIAHALVWAWRPWIQ